MNSNFKRLLKYLKPYRFKLIVVFIFAILSTIFTVFAPFVIGAITTTLVTSITSGVFAWEKIISLLVILGLLYVVSSVFSFVQNINMASVSCEVMENIRQDIDSKIHRLKIGYFDSKSHGDILSVIVNDVDTINNVLSSNMTTLVTQIVSAIGMLGMMLLISPKLTIIPIVMVPLSILSASKVMKNSESYYAKTQSTLGKLNGYIEEIYNGQEVVQLYNYQDRALAQFESLNEELKNNSYKAETYAGAISPITTLVNDTGYILCATIGCISAIMGKITVGNVQAMLEYTRKFSEPFSSIASMSGSFGACKAATQRVFEILDAQEEDIEDKNKIEEKETGSVEFEHVSFGYDDNLLMKDVSFKVKPGQKVAIVGPTGAGKTTLINLLMRFYDIKGGRIKVNGVDVKDMSLYDLREHFGMVLQDAWLFEGSIKENISYSKDNMDFEVVRNSAISACAHNFIKTLPKGYDMLLSKGAENISQGERQLLTIARAIASDSQIMILDEATSNIDTHTEVVIQQAMDKLMQGRTSFVIAHRLSTIRNADMILYMEKGDIKEIGNHAQLMKLNGKYATLYNSQFQ